MNPPSAPKKVGAAAGAPSGPPPKTPPVAPTANRPGATTGQTAMNSSRTGENQNGTLRGRPRGPGVAIGDALGAMAGLEVPADSDPVPADAFEWTPAELEVSESSGLPVSEVDTTPVRPQMQRLSMLFSAPPKFNAMSLDDEMMPPEEEIDVLAMAQSLKDEAGQPNMVRLYEVLGHDVPDFKGDFNVRIAIFLRPQDTKPFAEYRNRIHPSCVVQEVINSCLTYIKRKGWQPKESDVVNYFGIFIPSDDTMREDEIMMNPRTVLWRFGFQRNATVRLVLKPKRSRSESHTTYNLKICVDGNDAVYRNFNFYSVTPLSKLLMSLKTRYAKEMEGKDAPYYGLYVYRGKKGFFFDDLNKSLSEMGILDGDILHWKRRQTVEFAVDRDASKKWMMPLDTAVSDLVSRVLTDMGVANPQQYAVTRTHGNAGASRSDLFLLDQTPIKTYRLSPGDALNIQKRDATGQPVVQLKVLWSGGDQTTASMGPPVVTKRYTAVPKKSGEVGLFQTVFDISLWDGPRRRAIKGDLQFTNYRLIFSSFLDDENTDYHVDIPLVSINRVLSLGGRKHGVDIECKDFRSYRIHCNRGDGSKRQIIDSLDKCLYPNRDKMFAFAFREPRYQEAGKNGWMLFDHAAELRRLGVGQSGYNWRITRMNIDYKYAPTYPAVIAVPTSFTDDELIPVFKHRSKGRIPALSWLHPGNGAAITRCSQPLVGISGKSSAEDAKLIQCIRESVGREGAVLHLVDARPKANAVANKALGGGFESSGGGYQGCEIEFCNIDNIHVMRSSLSQLKAAIELAYESEEDSNFWAKIDNTQWLTHVQLVMRGAARIVNYITAGDPVVIHCSDGWDRTSQLSSVAMLCLDPYYRTIKGFAILVEQEWLTFGHKFAQRLGHIGEDGCDKSFSDGERAPIFLQFIDCVWQMQRQFPTAFEFNEVFLLATLEHVFSCHFGTFLFTCERERKMAQLAAKTESYWSWVLDDENRARFTNPLFTPTQTVLRISAEPADVILWNGFYRRWYSTAALTHRPVKGQPMAPMPAALAKMLELKAQNEALLRRVAELEGRTGGGVGASPAKTPGPVPASGAPPASPRGAPMAPLNRPLAGPPAVPKK